MEADDGIVAFLGAVDNDAVNIDDEACRYHLHHSHAHILRYLFQRIDLLSQEESQCVVAVVLARS